MSVFFTRGVGVPDHVKRRMNYELDDTAAPPAPSLSALIKARRAVMLQPKQVRYELRRGSDGYYHRVGITFLNKD